MDHSIKFWDRIADRYARTPVKDEATYQKKLAITQGYLRPDMKVLEFGCGTGSTALVHAPHVSSYTAIDVSPKMISIAEQKLNTASVDNVTFKVAALDELKTTNESYDAVLGLSILHLLEQRDEAIHQVYQMLKPGGIFVSSTACLGDTMGYFRYIAPIGKFFGLMPLVRVFTEAELINSLESAGFKIDFKLEPKNSKLVSFLIAIKPD